jgi:hypothetical protein
MTREPAIDIPVLFVVNRLLTDAGTAVSFFNTDLFFSETLFSARRKLGRR